MMMMVVVVMVVEDDDDDDDDDYDYKRAGDGAHCWFPTWTTAEPHVVSRPSWVTTRGPNQTVEMWYDELTTTFRCDNAAICELVLLAQLSPGGGGSYGNDNDKWGPAWQADNDK